MWVILQPHSDMLHGEQNCSVDPAPTETGSPLNLRVNRVIKPAVQVSDIYLKPPWHSLLMYHDTWTEQVAGSNPGSP